MHLFIQKDTVKAFMKKLKPWKSNLLKNKFDMFPLLNDFCATVNIIIIIIITKFITMYSKRIQSPIIGNYMYPQ